MSFDKYINLHNHYYNHWWSSLPKDFLLSLYSQSLPNAQLLGSGKHCSALNPYRLGLSFLEFHVNGVL